MSTTFICAHGSLARQCRVCELEQEVASLKSAVSMRDQLAQIDDGRIAELIIDRDCLRAALAQVEWVTKRGGLCQWCGGSQQTGHEADCARQAALGVGTGEGE